MATIINRWKNGGRFWPAVNQEDTIVGCFARKKSAQFFAEKMSELGGTPTSIREVDEYILNGDEITRGTRFVVEVKNIPPHII